MGISIDENNSYEGVYNTGAWKDMSVGAKSHRELGLKGLAWELRVIPLYDPPLYDGKLLRAIYYDYYYYHRLRYELLFIRITENIADNFNKRNYYGVKPELRVYRRKNIGTAFRKIIINLINASKLN